MAALADEERVVAATRLGWAIAEVRGRLRRGPPEHDQPVRPEHALPLGDERSWREQTIETEVVAAALASALAVDFPLEELSGQRGNGTAAAHLRGLASQLEHDREHAPVHVGTRWDDLCEFLYDWDAKIQDTFAGDSFAAASGYQLGRGLAEVYWALDPKARDDDPRSWAFLLGDSRIEQLSRLLTSLTDYFNGNAAAAVTSSLGAWERAVADPDVPSLPDIEVTLHDQLRVWHDLLFLGQQPTDRVDATDLIAKARRAWPVVRAFLPRDRDCARRIHRRRCCFGVFVAGNYTTVLAPILTALGAFGVTSAGALARAKSEATSLLAQLRQAMVQKRSMKRSRCHPPASTSPRTPIVGADAKHAASCASCAPHLGNGPTSQSVFPRVHKSPAEKQMDANANRRRMITGVVLRLPGARIAPARN